MSKQSLSLRVSEELYKALKDIAHEHRTDVSKIVRPWVRDLALSDEYREEVPDHLIEQLEREQRKERNAPRYNRIHFPSKVAYQFRQGFENGDFSIDKLGDHAVEETREIWVEEAREIFADSELRTAAVEFVNAVADHAKDAASASEFGKLDPEEMFEHYAGVSAGKTRQGVEWDRLVGEAESRVAPGRSSEDIARGLSSEYGIGLDLATEAVEEVTEPVDGETETEPDAGADVSGVTESDIAAGGTVETSDATVPDHSETEEVEPSGELVQAARDALDAGKGVGMVPDLLVAQYGASEAEAVAARDAATDLGGEPDE